MKFKFMSYSKNYKKISIISLLFTGLLFSSFNVYSATVLKSGAWQSGGQGSFGGNISISPFGIGSGIGWTKVEGGNIIVSAGLTSAIIPSLFVPSSIYAYPVPYKPSLGHTRIRFDALSSNATIKIYDLSGECVKSINKSDSNTYVEWNVKGDNGRNLASGVYFYTVKSGADRKTGKIMIIR